MVLLYRIPMPISSPDSVETPRQDPKRRFDAVICDIDGCLGPESAAPLEAEALVELAEHNRRAIAGADRPILTVCSGRPQPFAEAICRFIHNDAIPCVAENGVWVYDPRLNRYLMDPTITDEHFSAVAEASRWVQRELYPLGVVIQPGKTASLSLWHSDTALLRSLRARVERAFKDHGWPLRVSMTIAWINCDLSHISKATGIARLLEISGLRRQRLAGIGDTLGDKAIADNVAFFACPDNADPRIKAHAAYVSTFPEVRGVLDILRVVSAAH